MSVTKRSAANDVGFVHEDRSAVLLERFGEGVGAQQDRAIAEIVVGVTQRREHEVQLLPVVAALPECGLRLDEQVLAVGVLAAIR